MALNFDSKRSIAYLQERVAEIYPGEGGYRALADDIFVAVGGAEEDYKKRVDFRSTVKRWLHDVKSLPTKPEYLMALATELHTSIDSIFYGCNLAKTNTHLSYETLAQSDDPLLYEKMKAECPHFLGGYDEYDRNLLSYMIQYHSKKLLSWGLKQKDFVVWQSYLGREFRANCGELLPLFTDGFDFKLFDQLYQPALLWFPKSEDIPNYWNNIIEVKEQDVDQVLSQKGFIEAITKIYVQEKSERNRLLFRGMEPVDPKDDHLPYLHGAFNYAMERAIASKNFDLIKPFLEVGAKLNQEVKAQLGTTPAIVSLGGEVFLTAHQKETRQSVSVVACPTNWKDLNQWAENPAVSTLLSSIDAFIPA
jgi:hypothetical protein